MTTYAGYVKKYVDLTVHEGLALNKEGLPFPATEDAIIRYLAWLTMRGVVTGDSHLSGLATLHKLHGFPTAQFYTPRVQYVKKACKRYLKQNGFAKPRRARNPLTMSNLRRMLPTLALFTNTEHLRFWCVTLTGLFGIMRAGELTISTSTEFNPHLHVTRKDVFIAHDHATLFLAASKTDRFGSGTTITLPHVEDPVLCAHCMLRSWLSATPDEPREDAHLFSINGKPYAKPAYVAMLHRTLRNAGINPTAYNGHSLRLGGATFAKAAGLDIDEIMALGRWTTDTYQRYIKYSATDRCALASRLAAAALARPAPSLSEQDYQTWADHAIKPC